MYVSQCALNDLLGKDAARALLITFGGVRTYIPKTVKENAKHEFIPIIGAEGFRLLCEAYGGGAISLCNGEKPSMRRKKILEALACKKAIRDIAIEYGVTERYVNVLLAKYKPRAVQLPLL